MPSMKSLKNTIRPYVSQGKGESKMIDREYNKFRLVCDVCGNEETGFDYFDEAVEAKKELGWVSRRVNGEYQDICPDCQE